MFETYGGADPLGFVLSHNLHRRHLTDDHRRMVAARIANMRQGRPDKTYPLDNISREKAAELLAVDVQGVDRAKVVLRDGAEELQQAVDWLCEHKFQERPVRRNISIIRHNGSTGSAVCKIGREADILRRDHNR